MADAITIKALQDASLDAKSLEEVVNGDEAKQVTTRLGENYPSVKKAIKTMFENGSLPATPFKTKALMAASTLVDGDYAMVTDDSVAANNGLYLKTAGTWVKSDYDPLSVTRRLEAFGSALVDVRMGGTLYVENNDNNSTDYSTYIKVSGTLYISRPDVAVGLQKNWEQIVIDINRPDLIVTSPKGEPECLKLNTEVLVYNNLLNKFQVMARHLPLAGTHIVLAAELYGKLNSGAFFNTWVRQNITAVNLTGSFLGGTLEGDKYNTSFIYAEESTRVNNHDMYFKSTGQIWLSRVGVAAGLRATWDRVLTDINRPDLVVTSPKGVEDCLLINTDVLVYNNQTNKFELVLRQDVRLDIHSPLVRESYGQFVGGALHTAWLRQSKRLAYFYMDLGFRDTAIPIFDMSTASTTAVNDENKKAYIKFPVGFRIRRYNRTWVFTSWQKVIDDIDDPTAFGASRTGEPDCLILQDNCLVYNFLTDKFQLNPDNFYDDKTEVLIASSIYGQVISGIAYDWWLMKKATTISQSSGGAVNSSESKPQTRFIAHGGMNGFMQFAPLNTAPSYRNAGEYGYWGAETDIVETKDGEWIHCHDPFLSDYIVGGTGNFIDYTLAEIKAMDATKKSAEFGWSDVPPLELSEFLEICKQYGMTPVIEFKSVPTVDGVNKVLSLINSSVGESNCILMSFKTGVLDLIRSINSRIKLFLLTFVMTQAHTAKALSLGNCGLSVRSTSAAADIKQAREAGVEVSIWTVSQGQIDSDLSKGVDYVTTDIGVPYDFKKGVATYNFKSNADFSNLTSKGTATAANSKLDIPASSNVYLDIPVSYGDVITVSCEAKASDGGSVITIRGLNTSLTTVRDYTARAIKVGNFAVHTAAGVVYDKSVTSVRVLISSGSTASSIRDIKIKKYEV